MIDALGFVVLTSQCPAYGVRSVLEVEPEGHAELA